MKKRLSWSRWWGGRDRFGSVAIRAVALVLVRWWLQRIRRGGPEGVVQLIGDRLKIFNVLNNNLTRAIPVILTLTQFSVSLLEENIMPRTDLSPLLVPLRERRPEKLHYIGVSFGLTLDLLCFWRKHKFAPFYIGQIPSAVTGEHTCMALRPLSKDNFVQLNGSDQWRFYQDFRTRFVDLFRYSFHSMEYKLAMSVLDPKINFTELEPASSATSDGFLKSLNGVMTLENMKELEAYTNNIADFRSIMGFVPRLSEQYFQEKIPVTLSYAQASVLLCVGLQSKKISAIEGEMGLEGQQILSLFIKVMKKFYKYLYDVASEEIDSALPRLREIVMEPHAISVDRDLDEAAKKVKEGMKVKMDGMLDPELFQQYVIGDREAEFENALQNGGKIPSGGLISVKSSRNKMKKHAKENVGQNRGKRRSKEDGGSKSNKKRKS